MSLEFKTAKKSRQPIEFTLDGDKYKFTPHKNAGVMLALAEGDYAEVMKQTFDWLSDGLPEAQNKRLIDRLKDPEDEFDENDLQEIIANLQKEVAGRPTT